MPVVAERLNDTEPIVLFTYEGILDAKLFKEVIDLNAQFIEEIGEPIYIIADVRQLTSTFMDMLQVMGEAQAERGGSVHDENIRMLIFVGTSNFVNMYRNTMEKRGTAFGMSSFEAMNDALEAARIDIQMRQQAS